MEQIRIGIIGARARRPLTLAWQNSERSVVAAAMDIRQECLDEFRKNVNPKAFVTTRVNEILDHPDLDAIAILTPDFTHEEYALAAFQAGKHVFCEKPLAISTEGCDRILNAWKRSGKKLMVGHNMRYFPAIRTMKEIIDSGVIGEVKTAWCRHFIDYGGQKYFHDWHATRTEANSLLLQKGAHDIDILHWLANGYSRLVTGMGSLAYYGGQKPNKLVCGECDERDTCIEAQVYEEPPWKHMCAFRKEIDVEDVNMIMMTLDNGVTAAYLQCHFSPDNGRNYTFIGTEGRVENTLEGIKVWTRRSNTWRDYSDRTYNVKRTKGAHDGGDELEAADFIHLLLTGQTAIASPVAARMAVATGIAGATAVRSGGAAVEVASLPLEIAEYEAKTQYLAAG